MIKQKDDFSFREPVGLCLAHAPHIDPKLFVGRHSEIDKIKEALNGESQEQRRLVLGGPGGIGKTQLAISYATRHNQEYTSVFWLNATSETTLKDGFGKMAKVIFAAQEPGLLEDGRIVGKVCGWLSHKRNTQWLSIVDNYDDPTQFNIDDYFPPASHGTVLVTTRRPDQVAGKVIRIQPLKEVDESLLILETRSERQDVRNGRS